MWCKSSKHFFLCLLVWQVILRLTFRLDQYSKNASHKTTTMAVGASPTVSAFAKASSSTEISILASSPAVVPRTCKVCSALFRSSFLSCQFNADLFSAIVFLAEKLCLPVGGVLTNPVNYTGSTSNVTSSSTPPVPFTGEGAKTQGSAMGFIISGIAAAVGFMLF